MIILILLYAVLVLIEVPGFVRKKRWRELTVFSVLIVIAFVIGVFQIKHIDIPNPVRDTQFFVKSLFPFGYD